MTSGGRSSSRSSTLSGHRPPHGQGPAPRRPQNDLQAWPRREARDPGPRTLGRGGHGGIPLTFVTNFTFKGFGHKRSHHWPSTVGDRRAVTMDRHVLRAHCQCPQRGAQSRRPGGDGDGQQEAGMGAAGVGAQAAHTISKWLTCTGSSRHGHECIRHPVAALLLPLGGPGAGCGRAEGPGRDLLRRPRRPLWA